MAKLQNSVKTPQHAANQQEEHSSSLKGTFASVMILGAIFLLSWFGIFLLFLSRN